MTPAPTKPDTRTPALGLILAGGLGRRMGGGTDGAMGGKSAKPFEALGGGRLIDRAIATAQAQCAAVAINIHQATPQALDAFAGFGLPLVEDVLPGHAGPLAGVLAGMEFAAARGLDFVLSLPCDCPFLPRDLAARLHQAGGGGLALAASGGRSHHVVALWPTRLREDLRRALVDEGLRKVGAFQQAHAPARVDWPLGACDPFFNVNTPEDLALARDLLAQEAV